MPDVRTYAAAISAHPKGERWQKALSLLRGNAGDSFASRRHHLQRCHQCLRAGPGLAPGTCQVVLKIKFPGFISPSRGIMFLDTPNGLAAASKGPGLGWMQIIFVADVIEGNVESTVASRTTPRLAWAPWMHTATTGPRGRAAARRPTW